jgi:hypothetical protein
VLDGIYTISLLRLHSVFISGNYCTCFGWYFHPSSEAHTTGICHTVTAICRYRGRVGTNRFECAVGGVRVVLLHTYFSRTRWFVSSHELMYDIVAASKSAAIQVFRYVTPWRLVKYYQYFEWSYYLRRFSGSTGPRRVTFLCWRPSRLWLCRIMKCVKFIPDVTALHGWSQNSSYGFLFTVNA